MNRRLVVRVLTALLAVAMFAVPASAVAGKGGKKKDKPLVVCKHGCKYRTIQKAVDKAGKTDKKNDMIKVKPGKYVEGVVGARQEVQRADDQGHQQEREEGHPRGQERQGPDRQPRQQRDRDRRRQERHDPQHAGPPLPGQRRLLARHEHRRQEGDLPEPGRQERRRRVQPQLRALHVRLRGRRLQRVRAAGATATPPTTSARPRFRRTRRRPSSRTSTPTRTCSATPGTNSKYVVIKDSNFYNNGVGIVPNTLDSEPFEPNGSGVIKDNNIFWNNFNYFLPNSPVKTVSGGLGGGRQLPDRDRRRPVRLRRLEGPEQPDLRQLHVGRRDVLRPARQRGRRRDQP